MDNRKPAGVAERDGTDEVVLSKEMDEWLKTLSIKKNIKNIVIPSEETRLQLYPLDYEEFRWALGDNVTMPLLLGIYEKM